MIIKNYKISEFLKQDIGTVSSYLFYLEGLNPKKEFVTDYIHFNKLSKKKYRCNSLWDLPFKNIEKLKRIFTSKMTSEKVLKAFSLVFGIDKWQVLEINIIDFYAVFNFIKQELLNIINAEKNNFKTEDNPKLILAGVEELNKFGALNVIDDLAKGDLTKWEEVENESYRKVHYKLWKNNITNKVNTNYSKNDI